MRPCGEAERGDEREPGVVVAEVVHGAFVAVEHGLDGAHHGLRAVETARGVVVHFGHVDEEHRHAPELREPPALPRHDAVAHRRRHMAEERRHIARRHRGRPHRARRERRHRLEPRAAAGERGNFRRVREQPRDRGRERDPAGRGPRDDAERVAHGRPGEARGPALAHPAEHHVPHFARAEAHAHRERRAAGGHLPLEQERALRGAVRGFGERARRARPDGHERVAGEFHHQSPVRLDDFDEVREAGVEQPRKFLHAGGARAIHALGERGETGDVREQHRAREGRGLGLGGRCGIAREIFQHQRRNVGGKRLGEPRVPAGRHGRGDGGGGHGGKAGVRSPSRSRDPR